MKISVKAIPNSKTEEVVKEGDRFLVRVKESAKEGRANRAVVRLLAQHFKVAQGSIIIVSGLKNKNKIVDILR
ncbi:MAG: hypothetical protein A2025_02640 [Chloroflexi bacterium RBG_19FT_COMBO_47_15]|nr:MAG: hypothetical protein A2025_02640 [Chloroflexi bacterium RBG_19FT_COMBO_47_15]